MDWESRAPRCSTSSSAYKPAKPTAILARLAEFVGGILVIAGLLTPLAALALSVVMSVAIVKVRLKKGFFAASGGYEFNLVPIAVAVALLLAGSGAYSIDAALGIFWG